MFAIFAAVFCSRDGHSKDPPSEPRLKGGGRADSGPGTVAAGMMDPEASGTMTSVRSVAARAVRDGAARPRTLSFETAVSGHGDAGNVPCVTILGFAAGRKQNGTRDAPAIRSIVKSNRPRICMSSRDLPPEGPRCTSVKP